MNTYLGFSVGQKITTAEPVLAHLSGQDGRPVQFFNPGMQGTIDKICPWVSRRPTTPGRNYFVVSFEAVGTKWTVALNSLQAKRP